ncbi:MAG: DUF3592 domain-containing protein [Planctomycetaceae bacterium]|jgi:hypothetical protein|nr:DUF3592 domain-containing protein [Phycisphaerales bacterium]MCE2654371.1 DUF3592 domain-containing protein [Planctomycetaceae bacterium]
MMPVLQSASADPGRWERRGGWLAVLVTVLMGVGVLGLWAGLGVAGWFVGEEVVTQQQSRTWPSVNGEVIESQLITSQGRRGSTNYRAQVKFRYTVGSRTVSASSVRALSFGPRNEANQRAVVARYRVGAPVWVYVDPADPSRAVLEPGLQAVDLGLAPAALTGVLAAALVGGLLLNRISSVMSTRVGGLVVRRGPPVVLKTATLWPAVKGLMVGTGVALGGTLACAMLDELVVPLSIASVVLALGGGCVGWWLWRKREKRWQDDLVIDRQLGLISPPQAGVERTGWRFEQIARVGAVRTFTRVKGAKVY